MRRFVRSASGGLCDRDAAVCPIAIRRRARARVVRLQKVHRALTLYGHARSRCRSGQRELIESAPGSAPLAGPGLGLVDGPADVASTRPRGLEYASSMTPGRRGLLFLSLALALSCSSKSDPAPAAMSRAAPPPASNATTDGGVFVPIAPWKATSARIHLSSFGFFQGSMRYAKARVDLTVAQRQALEGLRTRPNAGSTNDGDNEMYSIDIVDNDGSTASYVASVDDILMSAAPGVGTIAVSTLTPFLGTLTCAKSKAAYAECVVAPGAAFPVSCTATLGVDPGCENGVFTGSGCEDVWGVLQIPAAGTYELATVGCFENVTVQVLDLDGTTILGTSAPGTTPRCATLTQAFVAPGSYKVNLEKRNATAACGPNAMGVAGDYYFRVTPKP